MFGVVSPVSPLSLHIVCSAVPAVPQCSAAVQLRLGVVSSVSPVPPAFLRCSAAVQLRFDVVSPVSPLSLHIVRSAVPAVPQFSSAAVQLRLGVVSPVSPVPPAFLRCSAGETPLPSTHRRRFRYCHQHNISWYIVTRLVLNVRRTR